MTNKKIHIVAFDVPFPADYGGVIDVYFRIKALHSLGFKITLHCFDYGRGQQSHLNEITEKVNYYSRKKTLLNAFNKRPFIVVSRRSEELLKNLLLDENPILFEGLHTTWYLENPIIQKRLTIVRTHNIEHEYYSGLAKKSGFLKRIYFQQEAKKLKNYESILKFSKQIFCIREGDANHFKQFSQHVKVLPASFPIRSKPAYMPTENYALFHGNLSVSENVEAVKWIVENIWRKDESLLTLIIAGKNPSFQLIQFALENKISIVANPSSEEMEELISRARIHILVSDQSTGVKLKLLSSLQSSGHVLVNSFMVEGNNLGEISTICHSPSEFILQLKDLSSKELLLDEFNKRIDFLNKYYDTVKNCEIFEKLT